jgi:hypothetical protein
MLSKETAMNEPRYRVAAHNRAIDDLLECFAEYGDHDRTAMAYVLDQHFPAIATVMEATGWQDIAPFQQRVEPWFRECFPPGVCNDKLERGDRLLEEVLELLQSGDYPPERVAALRDYTWGRAKGEPSQEVGGVMVTLAAYCIAHGLEMVGAAETELARITRPEIIAKIRAKQATKPTGSALPIAPPPPFEGTKP